MTAHNIATFFICWAAVAATSFVLLYPFLSPGWRRSWIGWALLTSSTALALLLNLALAGRVFGKDFLAYNSILLTVTFLVACGATLKLTALLSAKTRALLKRDGT